MNSPLTDGKSKVAVNSPLGVGESSRGSANRLRTSRRPQDVTINTCPRRSYQSTPRRTGKAAEPRTTTSPKSTSRPPYEMVSAIVLTGWMSPPAPVNQPPSHLRMNFSSGCGSAANSITVRAASVSTKARNLPTRATDTSTTVTSLWGLFIAAVTAPAPMGRSKHFPQRTDSRGQCGRSCRNGSTPSPSVAQGRKAC